MGKSIYLERVLKIHYNCELYYKRSHISEKPPIRKFLAERKVFLNFSDIYHSIYRNRATLFSEPRHYYLF